MEITEKNLSAFARQIERLANKTAETAGDFAAGQAVAFRLVAGWIRDDFSMEEVYHFNSQPTKRPVSSDRTGHRDQGVRPEPAGRGEAGDHGPSLGADHADGAAGSDRQGTERGPRCRYCGVMSSGQRPADRVVSE